MSPTKTKTFSPAKPILQCKAIGCLSTRLSNKALSVNYCLVDVDQAVIPNAMASLCRKRFVK
ncbi:uncharacterized protein PHALS_15034 [Plasmopara halstedii]|uniref:Uncharacterized protein n=1 Tax=Plasmopara halstedii TaxID=4781 RepID=A0A0P1AA99_PLAHL|nr:uncharacterized protein PHALS_15034 [Plasmopara halstedii]CEG37183.1 hypothetical protein PHALS_15034 [Plasmopara halstedii]|eukprot:XP_024573552.1 hypothetical protein PHALS_15034 [Plasmopara halstedii]